MEATTEFSSEKRHGSSDHDKLAAGENFIVEELLDFSNDDLYMAEAGGDGGIEYRIAGRNSSADGSMVCNNVGENSNLSSSVNDQKRFSDGDGSRESVGDTTCYSSELCVPYDDEAELEWLSTIMDESYSNEEFQKLQLISKDKVTQSEANDGSKIHVFKPNQAQNQSNADTSTDGNKPNPIFDNEIPVPAKARSKRSRNAPCSWSSRLEVLSTPTLTNSMITTTTISTTTEMSSTVPDASSSNVCPKLIPKPITKRIKTIGENISIPRANNEGRRCLHCATDKTPQWRTGPMGPKTLCNACGVRYKSGRLVPEYRPAASPTFVMTKHSNSHRKVMELRRQKELIRQQKQFEQQQQLIHMFDVSDADDNLIHHQIGHDFQQLY